jgi:hypothetical protein
MKTSRRLFVALATTVALAAAASGPLKAADQKEHYGMVVFLKGSEFFNWAYAGFQDEAATLGRRPSCRVRLIGTLRRRPEPSISWWPKGSRALRSRRATRTLSSPQSTPV